jgi:glycerol-3-phosphate acyltransferase PlsX
VRDALGAHSAHPGIEIVDAAEVIGPDEAPVAAVRAKQHSSLVEAIRLVHQGRVAGAVSAGNTGALLAAGLLVLKRMPGVERPALTAGLPTRDGSGVLVLDVGANVEARPQHLVQYAFMGSLYAEHVLGRARPRVGLLNIGTEAGKGPPSIQEAYTRLSHQSGLRFVGNVESREILSGAADVLVTDGFVGNLVLKAVEGAAEEVMRGVRGALYESVRARLGGLLARPALSRLRRRFDYQEIGGVPLLGLNGVVVKAHGASRQKAFANAIARAREQAEREVNRLITEAMRPLEEESQ